MDPFAILGVSPAFELDLKAVEKTHRELSRALHPDKYTNAGASERLLALGRAVEVNEAWRAVKDPIRRAEALFALAKVATGEVSEPKPSGAFLMDMLEQREALADAKDANDRAAIEKLRADIKTRAKAAETKMATGFSAACGDVSMLHALLPLLGELRFYRRFLEEVAAIVDVLDAS
jgi:molecular chaperone HscB